MTLEEIKEWRKEDHVNIFTTDFPLNEDDVANIDWLIAEVERLQAAELTWYAKGQQDAAKRCAEIADECKYSFNSPSQGEDACLDVFEAIKKEFGV